MKNGNLITAWLFLCLCGEQAFSEYQPTPTDLELYSKQLQDGAECNLQIGPNDESTDYLFAASGGKLEHYSAPDKPFNVLGLQSKKIDTYFDPASK